MATATVSSPAVLGAARQRSRKQRAQQAREQQSAKTQSQKQQYQQLQRNWISGGSAPSQAQRKGGLTATPNQQQTTQAGLPNIPQAPAKQEKGKRSTQSNLPSAKGRGRRSTQSNLSSAKQPITVTPVGQRAQNANQRGTLQKQRNKHTERILRQIEGDGMPSWSDLHIALASVQDPQAREKILGRIAALRLSMTLYAGIIGSFGLTLIPLTFWMLGIFPKRLGKLPGPPLLKWRIFGVLLITALDFIVILLIMMSLVQMSFIIYIITHPLELFWAIGTEIVEWIKSFF